MLAVIVVALLASFAGGAAVSADSGNVSNMEILRRTVVLYEDMCHDKVETPEMGEAADSETNDFLKAVVLGYVNLDDYSDVLENESVEKQDFFMMLYKTVISCDGDFAIDDAEASVILNDCFDNAYIRDENRIAYAFMIKHGIISSNGITHPDEPVTEELCSSLIEAVKVRFEQGMTFAIGGIPITIGSDSGEVLRALGNPNRIDASEYGFEWYVYNENYRNFCMIGVDAGRVCAFFSNGGDFAYGDLYSGCDFSLTDIYSIDAGMKFFTDGNGTLDGIMYNPYSKGSVQGLAIRRAKPLELLDMVNAYRSKTGRTVYAQKKELNGRAETASAKFADGDVTPPNTYVLSESDVYNMYERLISWQYDFVMADNKMSAPIGIDTSFAGDGTMKACFVTEDGAVAAPDEHLTVSPEKAEKTVNPVDIVTTPVLTAPVNEGVYADGEDVVVSMAVQAAEQYRVEVFDVESDEYAVNKFITTDELDITLPAALFTPGKDYRIVISSITEEGEALSSEPVMISYGTAEDAPVEITSPKDGSVTEENFIDLQWEGGPYYDFLLELYDADGNTAVSSVISGDRSAIVDGVAPGEYKISLTALRRGTMIEKAKAEATVTVVDPVIETNEIILDPTDRYDFIYRNSEDGSIYFYNEELVDVETENSDGETEVVKKKKITQKRVKPTQTYKQLDTLRRKPLYTTGFAAIGRGAAGQAILSTAEKYLGVPYVWGGESPNGFDCSGLVQYVCNSLGIKVSRVAEDQFHDGVEVAQNELMPGDLVFFRNSSGYIHHVGIYAGDGMMLHAPRTGEAVQYQSLEDGYYKSEYAGARRVY